MSCECILRPSSKHSLPQKCFLVKRLTITSASSWHKSQWKCWIGRMCNLPDVVGIESVTAQSITPPLLFGLVHPRFVSSGVRLDCQEDAPLVAFFGCHVPPPGIFKQTGSPFSILPEVYGARKRTGLPVGVHATYSMICAGISFSTPSCLYQNVPFHGGLLA